MPGSFTAVRFAFIDVSAVLKKIIKKSNSYISSDGHKTEKVLFLLCRVKSFSVHILNDLPKSIFVLLPGRWHVYSTEHNTILTVFLLEWILVFTL